MTTRGKALLAAGLLTAATALGCGLVEGGTRVVDTALLLGELADQLSQGQQSPSSVTYRVTGAATVTVVRQPPATAFLSGDGRVLLTAEHLIRCDADTCHRAPNPSPGPQRDATIAGLVADVAGAGFVTTQAAVAALASAALVPGAKAKPSRQTIAGQESSCVDVTGLGATGAPGGDPPGDFSVCVTGTGVLASLRGTLDTGEPLAIEMTGMSVEADPAALVPPAGARLVDVATLPAR